MAYNNVPTIYGSAVQTAQNLGLLLDIPQYSTINEVLGNALAIPQQNPGGVTTLGMQTADAYNFGSDQQDIKFQYLVIGNGGHRFIQGSVGTVPYSSPIPHSAIDSGLFHMIPWIACPVTDDLSPTDRAQFRLRQTLTVDGVLTAFYFAKKINYGSTSPLLTITTVTGGVETTTAFSPTINNLIPTQPVIGATNSGEKASVDTVVNINLSAEDVLNIQNACALLYGDANQAIISELAICSGVDKPITHLYPNTGAQTPSPIVGSTTMEAVACQVACFISTYRQLSVDTGGVTIGFDIGVSEPLFGDVAGS